MRNLLTCVTLGAALCLTASCNRRDLRAEAEALKNDIATLEVERDRLRARLDAGIRQDPRLAGMPSHPLRVGVPTSLVRELVTSLVSGTADQVTLDLSGLHIRKSGEVRRLVTLGEYHLDLRLTRFTAKLTAEAPTLRFGGNRIDLRVPVRVLSGSGSATLNFLWDGRTIGGVVCGDMEVSQQVAGTVKPATYTVTGAIHLSSTNETIVARPRIPSQRIRVSVQPSKESWAAVQQILESKGGVCGFVLDRVNIEEALAELLARGFNVRLPTERIAPINLPVGVSSKVDLEGQSVVVQVTAAPPIITPEMIWLGADLALPEPPVNRASR